jgi:hypothetical protein
MVIHLSVLKVRLERYRLLLIAAESIFSEYGDLPLSLEQDLSSITEEIEFVGGLLSAGADRLEFLAKKP